MTERYRGRVGAGARWLIVPGLALIGALFLVPMGVILESALFEDGAAARHFAPFTTSSLYVGVMQNTVVTSLIVATLCLLAGYPVAFFITRQPPRRRPLL